MNLLNRLMHVTMITAALFFFAGCSSDVQSEKEAPEVNEGVLNKKNQVLRNTLKKESLAIHDLLYQTEAIRGGVLAEEIIADEEQSKLQTALSKNNSATKELLYECGLTEPELIDILGNANDERLALVGGVLSEVIAEEQGVLTRDLDFKDYVKCAGAVLDVDAYLELRSALSEPGKKIAKAVLKGVATNLVKQVATRLSGSLGVAITLAGYGTCLAFSD